MKTGKGTEMWILRIHRPQIEWPLGSRKHSLGGTKSSRLRLIPHRCPLNEQRAKRQRTKEKRKELKLAHEEDEGLRKVARYPIGCTGQ